MKARDLLPGEKFGRLTVIDRDYEREEYLRANGKRRRPYYKCKCECGNIISVIVYSILNNNTKSCGCLKNEQVAERGKSNALNLESKKFGNITIIQRDLSVKGGSGVHARWIGRCDLCGRVKSFRSSDLTSGKIIDCGCNAGLRRGKSQLKDLNNMQFGHLTVLHRDMSVGTKNGEHARWICRCFCGNTESVASDMLTSYGKDRCSVCNRAKSFGEQKIAEILAANNIIFQHNKGLYDCRYPDTNWALRFDFIVQGKNNTVYVIEYDGEQHFKEVPMWERTTNLQGRLDRDRYKNEWCKFNNIPLIRIPYTHLKDICINDLIPSKTAFLI